MLLQGRIHPYLAVIVYKTNNHQYENLMGTVSQN